MKTITAIDGSLYSSVACCRLGASITDLIVFITTRNNEAIKFNSGLLSTNRYDSKVLV